MFVRIEQAERHKHGDGAVNLAILRCLERFFVLQRISSDDAIRQAVGVDRVVVETYTWRFFVGQHFKGFNG